MNEDSAARYHRLRRRASVASHARRASRGSRRCSLTGASAALAARGRAARPRCPGRSPVRRHRALHRRPRARLGDRLAPVRLLSHLPARAEIRPVVGAARRRGSAITSRRSASGSLLTLGAGLAVYGAIRAGARLVVAGRGGAASRSRRSLLSRVAPVLLMPLFYRSVRSSATTLRERLLTLSQRAGVPVLGAFEWGLGEKTTRANAALVGVGQHAPHPRVRHAAQGLLGRRDRGDPGARDRASRASRHLDGARARDAGRRRGALRARTLRPSRAGAVRRGRSRRPRPRCRC